MFCKLQFQDSESNLQASVLSHSHVQQILGNFRKYIFADMLGMIKVVVDAISFQDCPPQKLRFMSNCIMLSKLQFWMRIEWWNARDCNSVSSHAKYLRKA
jgi:hypothetical protein